MSVRRVHVVEIVALEVEAETAALETEEVEFAEVDVAEEGVAEVSLLWSDRLRQTTYVLIASSNSVDVFTLKAE